MMILLIVATNNEIAWAQNSLTMYGELGHSPIRGTVGGIGSIYKHNFNDRFDIGTGLQLNSRYPNFFGALMARGAFRFQLGKLHFLLDNKLLYRSFGSYGLNEIGNGLMLGWESKHLSVKLGNAIRVLLATDGTVTDGWTPLFEGTLRLKSDTHPWNVGLFVRNFDEFAFDGLTLVRWGAVGRCNVGKQTSIFANMVLCTAGNANAAAGVQEWYIRIGGTYKW